MNKRSSRRQQQQQIHKQQSTKAQPKGTLEISPQRQESILQKRKKPWHFHLRKIPKWFWATFGALVLFFSSVQLYVYFQSEVSIETQPNSGVSNPFDQEFMIVNRSALPIYNVTFHFELVDVNHGALHNMIGIMPNPIERITSQEQRSARIWYNLELQNMVYSGEVDESVVYTPSLWFSEIWITRRFNLTKNANGTFNWLAEGIPKKTFIPFSESSSIPTNRPYIVIPPQ